MKDSAKAPSIYVTSAAIPDPEIGHGDLDSMVAFVAGFDRNRSPLGVRPFHRIHRSAAASWTSSLTSVRTRRNSPPRRNSRRRWGTSRAVGLLDDL
jgi:hypothetical protein